MEISGYRVIRRIGAGAMGEVFLVQHPRIPRVDALKLLGKEISGDPVYRARFKREVATLASVSHPNIVSLHDCGESNERLWLTTEFVDGADVSELLHRGEVPLGFALEVTSAVAAALDFAWRRHGLVHRDVKPANILVVHEGGRPVVVKLADFGVATTADATSGLTETGGLVGTMPYLAPEVIQGAAADNRSDQYSLACSVYEMIAGSRPFSAPSAGGLMLAHLHASPPSLSRAAPGVPARIDSVLARAMSKDPAARFNSATEFAQAVGEVLRPLSEPKSSGAGLANRRRWRQGILGAVAGCAVTALALAGLQHVSTEVIAGVPVAAMDQVLDTGNLSTNPRPVTASADADAWQQEGLRMADAVVAPWEVDARYQCRMATASWEEVSGPVTSMQRFAEPGSARLFDTAQVAALRAVRVLAGYIAVSSDAQGEASDSVLRVGMLRFTNEQAVDFALQAAKAKSTGMPTALSTLPGSAVILDERINLDTAVARTFTIGAKRGSVLIVASVTAVDSEAIPSLAVRAAIMQVERVSNYKQTPTPPSGTIPAVPMDTDGIVSLTLPNYVEIGRGNELSTRMSFGEGYASPRTWAMNQGAKDMATGLSEFNVDLVASSRSGSNVVFRTADSTSARRMFAAYVAERTAGKAEDSFGVNGVPRDVISCMTSQEKMSDRSDRTLYTCRVHRGRYFAALGGIQKQDVLQGIAAQYRILGAGK